MTKIFKNYRIIRNNIYNFRTLVERMLKLNLIITLKIKIALFSFTDHIQTNILIQKKTFFLMQVGQLESQREMNQFILINQFRDFLN